jgi:hypothetical protein
MADMPSIITNAKPKPLIRFLRGYSYEVYKDRAATVPMALTADPRRLPVIGPWRPLMTSEQWLDGS